MKFSKLILQAALGAFLVGFFSLASSQDEVLFDSPGKCKRSDTKGCTRSWSASEKRCVLDCSPTPIPFTGLPIVVSGPLVPTGPASPGTNRMDPDQLRAIIRKGTDAQRAQVADWLATPTITLAIDPNPKPLPAEVLSPQMREVLKTIRQGTEKERAATAELLFQIKR
jgi:hypothetical protein